MSDQAVTPWRRTIRTRLAVAGVLFAIWAGVIEAQLLRLQIVQHDKWQARAADQRSREEILQAQRGEILDRHGRVLARSVDGEAVVAVPGAIKDIAATVASLCEAFGDCTAQERARVARLLRPPQPGEKKKFHVYIRRAARVSPEALLRLKALALPGIGFSEEPKRFYPNDDLAAHLLGYVGDDNQGLNGVEATHDKNVRGVDGEVLIQIDAKGRPVASVGRASVPGPSLQLTVDYFLQFIAEKELARGVQENNAAGGSAVIMNPRTGEILALANVPRFNPNAWWHSRQDERRNRAVQDFYEPGSTFKIVTASAALQEGVMSPDDPVDVSAGSIRIGSRRPISDVHRYGVLSFNDVIVKSSNVGAIKVGLKLGAERLGRYVHNFGFGTRLSPDFPGENPGMVWNPAGWNDSVIASVSMGYQVGVTPLQMATAVSAIANGGELVQPRILKATIAPDGRREEVRPRTLRRAIESGTAEQLTTIMEAVVEQGTGKPAKVPGYSIAGKTGTAAKLEHGRYSKSNYNASFVGFIPSRNPVLTILVVIDSPHGKGYYGGTVAAPVFKRIAETAMRHLSVPPNLAAEPPLLVARRVPEAAVRPSLIKDTARPSPAFASVPASTDGVPDVLGLSAREAIRVLARVGITARLSGDGVVVQQNPRPGSTLDSNTVCTLSLGRLASAAPGISDQRQ